MSKTGTMNIRIFTKQWISNIWTQVPGPPMGPGGWSKNSLGCHVNGLGVMFAWCAITLHAAAALSKRQAYHTEYGESVPPGGPTIQGSQAIN